MKSVLISIYPKFCELIFNGKKTIEVRKSAPKLETPFKVIVYETKGQFIKSVKGVCTTYGYGRGKVIGSFVCDRITNIHCYSDTKDTSIYEPKTCLTGEEICEYLNYEDGYGWHITEPKLFDKPKELSEFMLGNGWIAGRFPVKRAPQSYVYVEDLKENNNE